MPPVPQKAQDDNKLHEPGAHVKGTVSTDAGSMFLWDVESFRNVSDYDSWSKELEDEKDIQRHIEAGRIVPISWGGDSVAEVVARLGTPSSMSDREKEYVLVASQPYRFETSGSACISGIEMISGSPTDDILAFELQPHSYTVWLHMIAWMDEPGAENPDGSPSASALPDFIVCIEAPQPDLTYRTELQPYRQEDAQR
ncbi:MAG: hypothetical protein AAF497_22900 [Planctomycetota bacterium]